MTIARRLIAAAIAVYAIALSPATRAAPVGDWPCIQKKVAELSAAQMWAGPALEQAQEWRADPEVAALVSVLAARRTSLEEAAVEIERFAKAAGTEKERKLTLLFAGVFESLNAERARLVAGIERYARKQRALADRIRKTNLDLVAAREGRPSAASPSAPELEDTLRWDTRIYDERNQALAYVCESPVVIEQRAFALAREIQNHLG